VGACSQHILIAFFENQNRSPLFPALQCNAIAALHIIFLGFLSVALKLNSHLNPSKTIPVNLTTTATARYQR
jgi:hypothetical protein